MELKHLVQRCVYKIEPKPEGGFIARATDPTVPPLEAATREELQQKIQANLLAALGEAFPNLQVPAQGKQRSFQVHIDRKPEGGFAVHSEEAGANPVTHEKIDHAAEELLGFIDKHFPHLSEQFAAQVTGRNLQVFTTQKGSLGLPTPTSAGFSPMFQSTLPTPVPADGFSREAQLEAGTIENTLLNNSAIANRPITPEPSRIGPILRFLLTVLAAFALMYFLAHRR